MIILYIINLQLVLIFSIGVLIFVTTLSFRQRWKVITGGILCAVILIAGILLSTRAVAYQQDGEEFSKLVQQATLYLQKKNR